MPLALADRTKPLPFDLSWLNAPTVPAEPGVYDDVPFDVYERIAGLNRRVLEWIDADNGGSPLHAKAAYDGNLKAADRDSWRFGRAEHTLILEGEDVLRQRFLVAPEKCQATKNDGQPCDNSPKLTDGRGGWWCGTKNHAKGDVFTAADFVTEADIRRIRAMREAVAAHPFNRQMRRPGWRELVLVYDVPVRFTVQDGGEARTLEVLIRHRCRLDRLAEPFRGYPYAVTDLKRMPVGGGSRHDRERAILAAELHVQAALYTEGVRYAFKLPPGERVDFAWLFVEEGFPHDVVPFPASPDLLRLGQDTLDRRRKLWALCDHLGRWPGRIETRQLLATHVWGQEPPPPCEPPDDATGEGGPVHWALKRAGLLQTVQNPNGSEETL